MSLGRLHDLSAASAKLLAGAEATLATLATISGTPTRSPGEAAPPNQLRLLSVINLCLLLIIISLSETDVKNETPFEKPHWAAAVDGYTFCRGQRGRIVAFCVVCKGGFTVTEANAEAVRGMMIIHRDGAHVAGR